MKELTDKQAQALAFICGFVQKNGYPPTTKEVGDHFDINPNAAKDRLASLQRKGFISIAPRICRGVKILKKPSKLSKGE